MEKSKNHSQKKRFLVLIALLVMAVIVLVLEFKQQANYSPPQTAVSWLDYDSQLLVDSKWFQQHGYGDCQIAIFMW